MNVGDIVTLNLPGPSGKEQFRVMSTRTMTPPQRGPQILRLKSSIDGRTIFDYPSSQATKEDQ